MDRQTHARRSETPDLLAGLTQQRGRPGDQIPGSEVGGRARLGLSPVQVAGGALAATTSALAASTFGVGGTVIGAAVGSVISSVGGAIYVRSLQNVSARTRTVITRGRALPSSTAPTALPAVHGVDDGADDVAAVSHAPGRGRWGWRPVAAMGAGAFVLALGGITASELVLGHPVSNASEQGTTLTRVVDGGAPSTPSPSRSTPAPTTVPSGTPSGSVPAGIPSGAATGSPTATPGGTGTGTPGVGPTASGAATPGGTPSGAPTGSPGGPAGSGAATAPPTP